MQNNGVARTFKYLCTSKGDYSIKQCFSTITLLFEMGTSLKGNNLSISRHVMMMLHFLNDITNDAYVSEIMQKCAHVGETN